MSYELANTGNNTEEKHQIFYKIIYSEPTASFETALGLFIDEKEADKVFQQTVKEAEKFCRYRSEHVEKKDWTTKQLYYSNRYEPKWKGIMGNYYTVDAIVFKGYKKKFFMQFLECECYIYKTKIEVPLGQFYNLEKINKPRLAQN